MQLFKSTCRNGIKRPNVSHLLEALHRAMTMFRKIYVVLDALDEYESTQDHDLEASLARMHQWNLSNAHFLITSRRDGNVLYALETIVPSPFRMEVVQQEVDTDIHAWIEVQLGSRSRLGRKISGWHQPDVFKQKLQRELTERASGMYGIFQLNGLTEVAG